MSFKKILFVEDESFLREEIALVLEFEGYKVETAQDGMEALEIFGKFMPDLVMTDMKLPRLSGVQLIKEIRGQGHIDVPIIVTSAFSAKEWIEDVLSLGATNYLTKPFSLDAVLQMIEGLINGETD
ncbi:MAG: response regulator [Chloroflexota bacterium]